MPEVIIVKNEAEAGEIYGRCVADLIKAKPDAVLGLATGSSPLSAYKALAKIVKDESIDVSGVRGFALDEYIGLPLTHPESYHATIHRTVVEPLGLDPAKVHVPGDVLDGTPLGTLLNAGQSVVQTSPWVLIFPSVVLIVLTFSVQLIGDGLRDAIDPYSRSGGKAE